MSERRLLVLVALMLLVAAGVWFDRNHQPTGGQPVRSADRTTLQAITPLGQAVPRSPASDLPETGNPLGEWPLGALAEVLDRPLFNPSRRVATSPPTLKVADEPELIEGAADEVLDVALAGLLIGQSGRFALLRKKSTGAVIWLRESQKFDTLTLERVDPLEVVMVGPSGRHTLKVFKPEKRGGRSADARSQPDNDDDSDHEFD